MSAGFDTALDLLVAELRTLHAANPELNILTLLEMVNLDRINETCNEEVDEFKEVEEVRISEQRFETMNYERFY